MIGITAVLYQLRKWYRKRKARLQMEAYAREKMDEEAQVEAYWTEYHDRLFD